MPTIKFIHSDGSSKTVDAVVGESIMLTATRSGVGEILAECGGNAMCATCHVYIGDEWFALVPPMSDDEDALLDGVSSERLPTSRLSCQVKISVDLDGLVVRLPDKQF